MDKPLHYIAIPESGSGPGLVVLHSWWGLNTYFRSLCDRFAEAGMTTLAPDLFAGETASTVEGAIELRSRMTATRREPAYKILTESINSLSRHDAVSDPEVAVVGFSMGGHWALWLAQRPDLPISATVVFYAARSGDFRKSKSKFLFHFADDDEWVSEASKNKLMRNLEIAEREVSSFDYPGTRHWFFESDRPDAFHRTASEIAWTRTLAFLQNAG